MATAVGLLYPSEYEGFGLPVVEAMACGCPVVTLRRGALLESGGDAALFLDAADPDSLASAMNRLADDPAARAESVARGLAQAARFGRGEFAGAVAAVIGEVAAGALRPNRTRRPDVSVVDRCRGNR